MLLVHASRYSNSIFSNMHVNCCQSLFFLPYEYSEGITLSGSIHEVNILIKMADHDGNTAQLQNYISGCILWTWYSMHSQSSDLSGMSGEVSRQICNGTSKLVLTPRSKVNLLYKPVCWRWCNHHCCYYHNNHHPYMRPHCPVTDIKNNIFTF